MQDVAFAAAQQGLYTCLEAIQPLLGDECLDRAREAAAVDPDGPGSLQQLPSHRQGQGYRLVPGR